MGFENTDRYLSPFPDILQTKQLINNQENNRQMN